MSALVRSELLRLRSRRLYRWLVGLSLLGLTIGGVVALVRGTQTASFAQMLENVEGLGFPVILLGWMIGASAIGAEWGHRTVSALLTWEPRRTRVLAGKVVALSLFVAAVVVLLEGYFTLVMAPASAADGTFEGVDAAWWGDYAMTVGRVAAAAILSAWIGFGLAAIGRNTGAALGAGFVYLVVGEPLLGVWKPGWRDWFLGENLGHLVFGGDVFNEARRTALEAGGVLLLWAGVILLVAGYLFQRREMA